MTRIILDEDIKPLSEFRTNVTSCIEQARTTRRPLVITHHGKSAAVLLGVAEYEWLMQKMEILEDIRLAETQLADGKGIRHDAALKMVMSKATR
ncbi:MAG TPA: type II toxin-antitoxin system Phd/YefM family antitoxin [Kiritimatiellia bacterium]|nr:type II toxin-antitoxin system Phd/YefM family antitoxin [Kiritimatiellia bacterium]HMO99301.1 type II toxin-antitoxin system Phd/YefM family antitoxin [Kiritimatiellia bacterium]HMP95633.1 type II toxin-antitoxin system Phd/YefM family antitoxin [Kiritimatiellia bacterium]